MSQTVPEGHAASGAAINELFAMRQITIANDAKGHFRPIDNVYAMSAYPPTAVELSQRSEPPLRAKNGLLHCGKAAKLFAVGPARIRSLTCRLRRVCT
jgi:hypothetical protein